MLLNIVMPTCKQSVGKPPYSCLGILENYIIEKRPIHGKMEGKRQRGSNAKTLFQDLNYWTKFDMADASKLATDRKIYREPIRDTTAQIAPPD